MFTNVQPNKFGYVMLAVAAGSFVYSPITAIVFISFAVIGGWITNERLDRLNNWLEAYNEKHYVQPKTNIDKEHEQTVDSLWAIYRMTTG